MRTTVDTNVLVRAVVQDEPQQAEVAAELLRHTEMVAISLPCLCEFAWVLSRAYKFRTVEIASAIMALADAENVVMDRVAVEAGLRFMQIGGDFADGVVAHEGMRLGGETFASFDRKAVALVTRSGGSARLLG